MILPETERFLDKKSLLQLLLKEIENFVEFLQSQEEGAVLNLITLGKMPQIDRINALVSKIQQLSSPNEKKELICLDFAFGNIRKSYDTQYNVDIALRENFTGEESIQAWLKSFISQI